MCNSIAFFFQYEFKFVSMPIVHLPISKANTIDTFLFQFLPNSGTICFLISFQICLSFLLQKYDMTVSPEIRNYLLLVFVFNMNNCSVSRLSIFHFQWWRWWWFKFNMVHGHGISLRVSILSVIVYAFI